MLPLPESSLLDDVRDPVQFVLDVLEASDLGLRFLEIQASGIIGVELLNRRALDVALFEVFVVVQVAVVGRDSVEVAHVDGLGGLLLGEERLVHLLAVADADDLDFLLLAAEELAHGLRLCLDGAGRGLLDQDVAILSILEGEEDQIDSLLKGHDEPRHLGLGERDRIPLADLVDPQRNHAPARAHHIAVARAADLGVAGEPALRHRDLLLDRLGDAHRIDRVRGLVRGQANHALHARVDGRIQHIVRADDIGLHGLHREELAAGHLLERRGMEHVIHAHHRILQRALVAHIADVKLDLIRHLRHPRLEIVPHVVLLLLVARENADLADVRAEKTVQDGVAEGAGAAGNQQRLVFKYTHDCFAIIIKNYPSIKWS